MMTALPNLQSMAQFYAEHILNCAAQGTVIALLAGLVLRTIGPRSSSTRFAVWFSALLGIAALPLLGTWAADASELTKRSEITMPSSWAPCIFAAWLVVAAAGLFRVVIGLLQVHRLRKHCVPVDTATLDPILRKTLAEFDSRRALKLCVSGHLRVPTAIGFTRPMVVIPSWAMQELSTPELNTILLHELAHLRRRDDWTNLVQKVLGALLFFHPAVWWIEKKLSLEREMACDDLVLAQTSSPRAYAECLVSLAEKSFLRRGLALAQAAVDQVRTVSLRVTQILDTSRPRATRIWSPAPVLVGGVSLVCLLALSYSPTRLVSFENPGTASSSENSPVPAGLETGPLPGLGARVVPAKLQVTPPDVKQERIATSGITKSGVKRALKPTTGQPDVVPARAAQHRVKTPVLVRTSMPDRNVRTMFLVTQTELVQTRGYDASGAVVWDLCVWRVTVIGPVQNKPEAAAPAKSI